MNSETSLQQKIARVENLQSSQSSGRKFVANLTTQSFVSIFHHIQQQNSQTSSKNAADSKEANQVSGLSFNTEKIAADISDKLDEKQQKSSDSFDIRLERQKEKQQARAQNYDAQKFQDTFLGTMIAIMEAQQNNRKQPLIPASNETATESATLVDNVAQNRISTQAKELSSENHDSRRLAQNSSGLRLVIDGIPTQNSQNPTNAFTASDLSEQDITISQIFAGTQFSRNHEQLRTLTEGLPQSQQPSQDSNRAAQAAA